MVNKKIMVDIANGEESEWEINPGKSDKTIDAYISIESNLKPGMYLTVGKNYLKDYMILFFLKM